PRPRCAAAGPAGPQARQKKDKGTVLSIYCSASTDQTECDNLEQSIDAREKTGKIAVTRKD
ncbi:MAG: hypothetical protein ABS900_08570, partial [Candidatus Limivicinus sp.]